VVRASPSLFLTSWATRTLGEPGRKSSANAQFASRAGAYCAVGAVSAGCPTRSFQAHAAGQDEGHVSGEFAHAERLIKRRPILAGDVQSGDVFILFGCAALALGMLAWPFNESPRCIRSLESVVPLL
jgi:hypothetical protein